MVYRDTVRNHTQTGMVYTCNCSGYSVVGHGCGVGNADPRVTRDEPYSMEVGDALDIEVEAVIVDMTGVVEDRSLLEEDAGVKAREVDTKGNKELAGALVVAFWAGPITCSK
jgi:hypothetical protein